MHLHHCHPNLEWSSRAGPAGVILGHTVDRYIIRLKVPGRRSAEICNEKATEGFKEDNVLSQDISFQLASVP